MNKDLKEIIENSSFEVQEGKYIYAKVKSVQDYENHFMISRDKDEVTVVTRMENLKSLDLIEKNKDIYSLIALKVSVPFYSVGFLAAISSRIADEGMNILIISTYSRDYILVKNESLNKAKNVLTKLGFR